VRALVRGVRALAAAAFAAAAAVQIDEFRILLRLLILLA
jgi:hypothetical protein